MSLFATKKIVKEKGLDPEPFELDVAQVSTNGRCILLALSLVAQTPQAPLAPLSAHTPSVRSLALSLPQALCDLEANSNDLKAELRELYIVSAKEVDVTGRKAVVIFVPFKLLKVVHKIQSRLVREVSSSSTSSSSSSTGAAAAQAVTAAAGRRQ